ncbi:hypothetical protein F5884DRAFT_783526 [Xylogone sp. PMI_703]|nr:hypothetical protein F5884DRAFT_783526 [Xylogone sp. PMI_703]
MDTQTQGKKKKGSSKPKSRKSEPITRPTTSLGNEDSEHPENRSFLDLVAYESKKKRRAEKESSEYYENFSKKIVTDRKALEEEIEDLKAESSKTDDQFLNDFKKVYNLITEPPAAGKHKERSPETTPLYQRSQASINRASQLIEIFEQASSKIRSAKRAWPDGTSWSVEDEKLERLLLAGKQVGEGKFQRILKDGSSQVTNDESTALANELLFPMLVDNENTWGRVADRQKKACKKLVKTTRSV